LFEERRLPQWSLEAQVWKYKAAKEVTSPPITTGRVVNFASRDGSLYSVSAIDRKLVYQLETDKPIVAPLTRLENSMFVASEDNTFYALNLTNGKVQWEFTSGLPIRKAPWPIDHDLYVLPDRGGMYCLDPVTGDQRWWSPNLTSFVAVLGNSVAALDLEGNLVVIARNSKRTAEVIGSLPLRRFNVQSGNDRTDRIFLTTESGLVIGMRQIGHTYPVYHRYPDRLPLLPGFEPDEGSDSPSQSESTDTQ
jgi:outer membrane protein assembly factor BamB